jgi:hypothetical protein
MVPLYQQAPSLSMRDLTLSSYSSFAPNKELVSDHCELSGDKCKVLDVMSLSLQPKSNWVVPLTADVIARAGSLKMPGNSEE